MDGCIICRSVRGTNSYAASERAPHSREGKGREGQIGEETRVSARRGRGRLLALRWQWSQTSDADPAEDEEEEIDK